MAKPYDAGLLTAALAGYQTQLDEITSKIAALRKLLGQRAPAAPGIAPRKSTKHRISDEGRARIAAAQKRRWAAARKGAKVKTAGAE